jgi:hypothetical protein
MPRKHPELTDSTQTFWEETHVTLGMAISIFHPVGPPVVGATNRLTFKYQAVSPSLVQQKGITISSGPYHAMRSTSSFYAPQCLDRPGVVAYNVLSHKVYLPNKTLSGDKRLAQRRYMLILHSSEIDLTVLMKRHAASWCVTH